MTSQPPDQHPAAQPAPDRLKLPGHAAAKPAKPRVWTDERKAEVWSALLVHIADGGSLDAFCERDDMPSKQSVYQWIRCSTLLADEYARAREMQGDSYADKVADVTDLVIAGTLDPQAGKTASDNYKWLAGKRKPKVYGVHIDVNSNVNVNVTPGWVLDLTPVVDVTAIPDGTAVQTITGPNEPDDPPDVD
jgi:hypothetical protein